jgi:hypothetical protein
MTSFPSLQPARFEGVTVGINLRARFRASLAVALVICLQTFAQPALAETLLTISGGPDAAGNPFDITYDLAALQALPKSSFVTATMWTEGEQTFEGVSLHSLLDMLDVTSGKVLASAINDYRIEIPLADITPEAPIIAYLRNGEEMTVRDKGPLWIVYPYDSDPQYQSEVVFSRSIWQLNRIEIAP